MYVYTDTQFNLMRIYWDLLMNRVAKEKGTLSYFKKVGNTAPNIILVKKHFWSNP